MKAKYVELKHNDDSPYNSWAEQMLEDKLAKYNRKTQEFKFKVVKETEKAFQVLVTGIYKSYGNDYVDCEDWDVWMPKTAFIGYEKANA